MNTRGLIQCLLAIGVLTLALSGCGESKGNVNAPNAPSADIGRYNNGVQPPAPK